VINPCVGFAIFAKVGNFSYVICSHLNHGNVQQVESIAKIDSGTPIMVVEISFRSKGSVFSFAILHSIIPYWSFFRWSLLSNDGNFQLAPMIASQLLQTLKTIIDQKASFIFGECRFINNRISGSFCKASSANVLALKVGPFRAKKSNLLLFDG